MLRTLVFTTLCLVVIQANILGVSPSDQSKYPNLDKFTCLDQSKSIPFDRINDDYCDCPDGSDEPGTSACAGTGTTKFYCPNKGFYSKFLHNSFVNDGVCDCCDGSDEWGKRITCVNTCLQDGAEIRQVLTEKIATLQHGITMKHSYSQQGMTKFDEKTQQLKPMLEELAKSELNMMSLETQKNTLEKVEEAERNLLKTEAEKKVQEAQPTPEVTSQETSQEATTPSSQEGQQEGATTLETTTTLPPTDDFSSYKNQEAETARTEYNSKRTVHDKLKSDVEALQKELALNFGKDKEYYPLYEKCFSADHREYTYEVCFYKNAYQKSKSGSSTALGQFVAGNFENGIIKFTDGQHCWNGPARSMTVSMKCGLTEQLLNIDEPSMCVYSADFQTPAACSEEELEKMKKDFEEVGGEL